MNFTIGDGFKFGCGLLLAGAFATAALLLIGALVVFLSTVSGQRLPFPVP